MIAQFGIAFLGVTAIWLSQSEELARRRWAPVFGLAGQPCFGGLPKLNRAARERL